MNNWEPCFPTSKQTEYHFDHIITPATACFINHPYTVTAYYLIASLHTWIYRIHRLKTALLSIQINVKTRQQYTLGWTTFYWSSLLIGHKDSITIVITVNSFSFTAHLRHHRYLVVVFVSTQITRTVMKKPWTMFRWPVLSSELFFLSQLFIEVPHHCHLFSDLF